MRIRYTPPIPDPDPATVQRLISELNQELYISILNKIHPFISLADLVCPKVQAREKIPRPQNPFILYRRVFSAKFKSTYTNLSIMSQEAAVEWSNEDDETRRIYTEIAKLAKEIHRRTYPGYRFNPIRRRRNNPRCQSPPSSSPSSSHSPNNFTLPSIANLLSIRDRYYE